VAPFFELVVPCFNESESLNLLVAETVVAAESHGLSSETFQLILVDNGSKDPTASVLSQIQQTKYAKWFRVVSLEKNRGYGGGILSGLSFCTAPWVGYIHADLQCDPKFAFQSYQECRAFGDNGFVKGARKKRLFSEWCVSRCYELVVGLLWGLWRHEINAQPKVFSKTLLPHLVQAPQGISFDAFVLLQAKQRRFHEKTIQVDLKPRVFGNSHWATSFKKKWITFWRVFKELQEVKVKVLSPSKSF